MHIDFLLIGKTGKKIVDNGSGYTHRSNKFLVRQSHSLKYAEIIYYLSNILIVRLCRYRDMHTHIFITSKNNNKNKIYISEIYYISSRKTE